MKSEVILVAGLLSGSAIAANEPANLSLGMAFDQELSVVLELDNKYRGIIGNDGMAFDYIAKRGTFEQNIPLTWYAGIGGWYEWNDEFGLRVPLGVNWALPQGWDLYGQIHPELELYKGADLQIGAAVGIKYRF